MAAVPAMSLKIYLLIGENPPDEFGQGHYTSRYQCTTAFPFLSHPADR
jgi:hypothetical protein